MSLNDSLFGEEAIRWAAFIEDMKTQQKEDENEKRQGLHNPQNVPHPVDKSSKIRH